KFAVVDQGLGRVALRAPDGRFVSVPSPGAVTLAADAGSDHTRFQWIENVYGDLILLSLVSDRYLHIDPTSGAISADQSGPAPDRRDGTCLDWAIGARE